MILYHAADLIWATKIKTVAEASGFAARPVRSVEMLDARLADSPVRALMVDLEAPDVALALLRRVREQRNDGSIRTLAFGPHVAAEWFDRARASGADLVMARGALNARMPMILKDLATSSPSAASAADQVGRPAPPKAEA